MKGRFNRPVHFHTYTCICKTTAGNLFTAHTAFSVPGGVLYTAFSHFRIFRPGGGVIYRSIGQACDFQKLLLF